MASTSVVFPWSTWAMMAMLRTSVRRGDGARELSERRDHFPGKELEALARRMASEAHDEGGDAHVDVLPQAPDDLVGCAGGAEIRGAGEEADLLVHLGGPASRLVLRRGDRGDGLLRDLDLSRVPVETRTVRPEHPELVRQLEMGRAAV